MASRSPSERAAYDAARRARPDLLQKQDESGHGVRKTYSYWFCRCRECTDANADYWINYMRNRGSYDQ